MKILESFFTSNERDRSAYHGDWTLILTSVLYFVSCAIAILEYYFISKEINIYFFICGSVLIIVSAILRRWSIKSLGDQWAIHAVGPSKIISENHLVHHGPYRIVRHPIYVSYILDLLGFSLVFNALYTIIFIIAVNIPSYIVRARFEEETSKKKFGSEYDAYRSKTYSMLPFINTRK
ncbi:MAG: isoprenylcysteine carboxylmethyltransferase family protein [Patescibacteria group bacterium]|nr:isoprenylcysteine carboxylmethyltransferase family protein [Patescibacteria group bacterium]